MAFENSEDENKVIMADEFSMDDSHTASVRRKRACADISCGTGVVGDLSDLSPTKRQKKGLVGEQELQDFTPKGKFNAHGEGDGDGDAEERGNADDRTGSTNPKQTVSLVAAAEATSNGKKECDSDAISQTPASNGFMGPAAVARNCLLRSRIQKVVFPSFYRGASGFSASATVSRNPELRRKIQQDIGASSSSGASRFSAPASVTQRQRSDPELRRKIHTVETDFSEHCMERDEYNEERFKLYTEEEAKEAFIVWPREVNSPAGYRSRELKSWWTGLDDTLFTFGWSFESEEIDAYGGLDEYAAKQRWRDEIERKFEDPEEKKAEFERWEKIREVETEYCEHRIQTEEYNERRFALYSEEERKEKGIFWCPAENGMPRSPAGFREFILEQFVPDGPDWRTQIDFHCPHSLESTDTPLENDLCEFCISVINEQRAERKRREAEEAQRKERWKEHLAQQEAKQKANKEKREAKKKREAERRAAEAEKLLEKRAEELTGEEAEKLLKKRAEELTGEEAEKLLKKTAEELTGEEAEKLFEKRIEDLRGGVAEAEKLLEKMKEELRVEVEKRDATKEERRRLAEQGRTVDEQGKGKDKMYDPKPHHCTRCNKKFATGSALIQHTKDKHKLFG